MSKAFNTISETYSAELVEKKSRFIAQLSPAKDEQAALDFLQSCRKTHYNAKHNCSAYIIGYDGRLKHSSDDGEPSGTAGTPMLSILEGRRLFNVIAVVTRYFGGTLLGTGGLVRAYSGALEKCLEAADIIRMVYCCEIKIEAPYAEAGKLQYMFARKNIRVITSEYTELVTFNVLTEADNEASVVKAVIEATSGSARCETVKSGFYPV